MSVTIPAEVNPTLLVWARRLAAQGGLFVQLVLKALDANRITAVDASRYLDLRFDHIEKLRAQADHRCRWRIRGG